MSKPSVYWGRHTRVHMSKKKKRFPYDHVVNEETKTIEIDWEGNGQLARYGVPHLVEKYYPGYSYTFAS